MAVSSAEGLKPGFRPEMVLVAAAGTLWVVGGTALVLALVPESPGRDPNLLMVLAAFGLMLGLSYMVWKEAAKRPSGAPSLLKTGAIFFGGLFAVAFVLEGPATFELTRVPIKLVAATSFLPVYLLTRVLLHRERTDEPSAA